MNGHIIRNDRFQNLCSKEVVGIRQFGMIKKNLGKGFFFSNKVIRDKTDIPPKE